MKTTKLVFVFLIAIAVFSGALVGDIKKVSAAITVENDSELDADTAGILPTNPVYFMKQFGWNFRRFFTFSPVHKIDLELKIADQKIAEMKKLKDINLDTNQSLNKAIAGYEESLGQIKDKLDGIKNEANLNLESVLNTLAERVLRHKEIFNRLKEKHESLKSVINRTTQRIDAIIEEVSGIRSASLSNEL